MTAYKNMKTMSILWIALILAGCATARQTVRQEDIDAWVGVPVKALDTHSLFLTVPLIKTKTEDGTEIRNYANKANVARCTGSSFVNAYTSSANFNNFQNCTSQLVGCDNIFYIKKGRVIKYKPTGQCFTDKTVQPEDGWEKL